jgi:hypothetical protein
MSQYISAQELAADIEQLTPALQVRFRKAHTTYITDARQGLQESGQIVEEIVKAFARFAVKKTWLPKTVLKAAAADAIDALYDCKEIKDHRAALGGARSFMKTYRNPSSHPAKNHKDAAKAIKVCRDGFRSAAQNATALRSAAKALMMPIVLL